MDILEVNAIQQLGLSIHFPENGGIYYHFYCYQYRPDIKIRTIYYKSFLRFNPLQVHAAVKTQ